jgi:CubicO group peptidase (beta-lactamase class C family)
MAQRRVLNISKIRSAIDSVANEGIRTKSYPGCQIVISQFGKVVFSKCYGVQSEKTKRPVLPTDLYDLASVTKSTATLLAIMKLYECGKLKLSDKASKYLSFLRHTDKENITITDLLFHQSGLPMTISFYYQAVDPRSITPPLLQEKPDAQHPGQIDTNVFMSNFKYRKGAITSKRDKLHNLHVYKNMWLADSYIDTLKKDIVEFKYNPVPKHYQYSDIGYITLQWIVEKITHRSLSDYVEKEFYKPMGALRTMFNPYRRYPLKEIVPTVTQDFIRNVDEICGYTQDEVAAYMGGVAGEAGLYSTALDLAKIYQMYLNLGVLNGKRYLKASTCRLFETKRTPISNRGLGFDRPPKEPGEGFNIPSSSFGHGGFTGTNVWVDPTNQIVYVYLCNRVSPFPWNNRFMDLGIYGKFLEALYRGL